MKNGEWSDDDLKKPNKQMRSVWQIDTPKPSEKEFGKHPTQKPVGLCEYLIRTYTCEGETVLDCCMGSGTTGVAAVQSGRSFIGIELDEEYFETARHRIAEAKPVARDFMNGQTRLGSFDAEEAGQ